MPVRFRCTNCRHLLSIGRRKAGSDTNCPLCRQRQIVPHPASSEPVFLSAPPVRPPAALPATKLRKPEGPAEPRRAETVTWVLALTLAVALVGFLGLLARFIPKPPRQPGAASVSQEPLASNLDQIHRLPVLPEVESPPKDAPVPLPPQAENRQPDPPPPVEKREPDPPPPVEKRKPDPPPPARPSQGQPRDNPPPVNQGGPDALREALVKAPAEQQDALLDKLCKGKGPDYSDALAAAIGQMAGKAQEKARQTLVTRFTRFTAKTLLDYLRSENAEQRRAAALVMGCKDYKDHIGALIDLLEDPEKSVQDAAHEALNMLTKGYAASGKGAEAQPAPAPPLPATAPPAAADSRAARAEKPKKDAELPEVGLVPPEETPSSVKALLRVNALALSSKSAAERIRAAQMLGELGQAGKPARRLLCAALLDPVIAVRAAAADALKSIDPRMHYLAVVLASERVATGGDAARVAGLLKKIQGLEDDGEPLAPLVAYIVAFAASHGANDLLTTALAALARIGRKDLPSCRVVASALGNQDPAIRALALRELVRMKHGKLAAPKVLYLLRSDVPANRIAAIEALVALADESTEEIIAAAINAQRYHSDEAVRRAVEAGLNKLEDDHDRRERNGKKLANERNP
jgi:HEAT repeat protein